MLLKFSGFSSRLAGSVVVIMPAGGASRRGSAPAPCFLIISFFRLKKKIQVPGAIPAINATCGEEPSNLTNCVRSDKYEKNHSKALS